MTISAEYRQNAEACLLAAQLAMREDVRRVLIDCAQKWIEAAQRAERNAASLKLE